MSPWNYIVVLLCLIMLALLLVCEVRRANRSRLGWRIAAVFLMVASLAAMALPLGYMRHAAEGNKEGVLLTEGYHVDSIKPNRLVWTAPEDIKEEGLSKLHIYGYGLTGDALALLPDVPIVFHPSPMGSGVVSLHWKEALLPGEVCRIQGRCYNPTGAGIKLLLTGMNTVLDSAEIKLSEGGDFELRMGPAQTGRAVYRLIALSGVDTLEQEPIPVEVLPGKSLRVLVLAAAPDFENRFLAGWLSDKGHGVAIRTAISKGKYDHAYLNIASLSVDHLSSTMLGKFDVVIADAAELKAMGAGEYAVLRNAIAEKGLGLIIKADSSSLGHGVRATGGNDSLLHMVITDKAGDRPMIKDTLSRTVVGASMYGAGKIILTTLPATYVRLLAGEKKAYAALWTSILQEGAGAEGGAERWKFIPALPTVNQPVRVLLQSAESSLPQGMFEGGGGMEEAQSVVVYLAQQPLLPFAWEGCYWPRDAGWQTARTSEGGGSWWYVWKEGDWRNLHRMERMRETERWIADGERKRMRGNEEMAGGRKLREGAEVGSGENGRAREERGMRKVLIAKGWFCLLFLICCFFLWVERKI